MSALRDVIAPVFNGDFNRLVDAISEDLTDDLMRIVLIAQFSARSGIEDKIDDKTRVGMLSKKLTDLGVTISTTQDPRVNEQVVLSAQIYVITESVFFGDMRNVTWKQVATYVAYIERYSACHVTPRAMQE